MPRRVLALAVLVAAGTIAAGPSSARQQMGRQLIGTVGPGFTITLTDEDGAAVSSLTPGVYWLTVSDKSALHNFHIFGPGLNDVVTTVPEIADSVTVKIVLKHGTYTFQCDPHASFMHGTFEVGGVGQTG
jgi:hypothetical protein